MEPAFEQAVSDLRNGIKTTAAALKGMKADRQNAPVDDGEDRGEVMANLMLAYRCLEDASMRLGKVIQAHDGGVSVYDK